MRCSPGTGRTRRGQTLPIRVMCVDAGYATQDVYAWVRQHPQASWGPAGAAARQPRTAVAVKGRDQDTALLLSVSRADAGGKRRGLRVWSVGTPVAKGELYRWLKLEWPTDEALEAGASYPPGACHFPQYGEEYFKQLTAERLVTRIVKGFPRGSWEKEPGRRNEALDCRVYARAAAAICGIDRWPDARWRELERYVGREEPAVPAAAEPSATPHACSPQLAPRAARGLAQPRQAPLVVGSLSRSVTRWMAANVAVAQDPAGNLKPAKDKSTERIDGIVAAIMAIGRAMVAQEEPQPSYSMFFV